MYEVAATPAWLYNMDNFHVVNPLEEKEDESV